MGALQSEIEISDAAIGAYGRLLRAVRRRLVTHAAGDGGLICEDRSRRSRPTLWRVRPNGVVVSDSPYDYARRAFVPAGPPWAKL